MTNPERRSRVSPQQDGDEREEARDPSKPRGRGRPARLSQARIVDAVLALLEQAPSEIPTIARIAREVDAVPAALYRHFGSLDDIFEAVLGRVLEASRSEPEDGAPWEEQLASWMQTLRSHLLEVPAVLAMIDRAGRTSPAWLEASSALVEILERAGLEGRDLAAGYLWILETTVGLVMQEAALPLTEQIANANASRRALAPAIRVRFAPIAPELAALDPDDFFAFVVDRTTAAIELMRATSRQR